MECIYGGVYACRFYKRWILHTVWLTHGEHSVESTHIVIYRRVSLHTVEPAHIETYTRTNVITMEFTHN